MYSIISKLVSRGVQSAVKQVTLTTTQKTVATVASKVAIATATTAGAMVINNTIQDKSAKKIEEEAKTRMESYEAGEAENFMTDDEIRTKAKKAQTKANVASGAVIGVGTAASTLVDVAFKAI